MLQVLEALCVRNDQTAQVVVESNTLTEAGSTQARQMALEKAGQMGLSRPGIDDASSAPYPVDAEGKSGDDVIFGRTPVAAYRADFKIRGGL